MLLPNLHDSLICALSFSVQCFWLAAFYYANPLFLMGISFLIYAHFSGTQLGRKTRAGYTCDGI
jgi:hypothetical protein